MGLWECCNEQTVNIKYGKKPTKSNEPDTPSAFQEPGFFLQRKMMSYRFQHDQKSDNEL